MAMPADGDKVERVGAEDMPPEEPQPKYGGLRQIIIQAVVSLIVTIAVLYVWVMPSVATTKTDLQNMAGDVAGVKTSITTLSSDLSNKITQLSNSISNLVTSDRANSLISSQITPLQQSLNSLQSAVSKLPTSQPDIAPLTKQLDALQKALDTLTDNVTNLIKATPTPVPVPTVTSFTPTSGTTGTSVVITGTNLLGATAVYFDGTIAQSFTVNAATQITAIVGSGSSGVITVTASGGTAVSTGVFTFTGTTPTPTTGQVVTTYPTSAITLVKQADGSYANNFSITISNGLAKDIFSGQLQLTIQYIGVITPIADGAGVLTVGGLSWNGPTLFANSFIIVSNPGLYITANGATTLTINFSIVPVTPIPAWQSQYIRITITGATFTGYMQ